MPSAQSDLRYLEAATGLLEDYLLSKDVYWQLGADAPAGDPPFPSLTLGGVLLAQARLNARALEGDLRSRRDRINFQIEALRMKWRVAWERKAREEFSARLVLWRNFLEDYRLDPDSNADRYPYEVGRRVMLDLLEGEAGQLRNAEREMFSGLDLILNAYFQPGDFVWEPELVGGFPKNRYSYLYGRLKG
jgi:hypothetical protein